MARHTKTPLSDAAVDTERHVARSGWDQPPRLFALVQNAALVRREPTMAEQLGQADPSGYSAVEQTEVPTTEELESMLGQIAWPAEVDGVAIAVERIVVPPEAERDLPEDPEAAVKALADHPARKDVRILAAVLRSGESICLLRQRDHDEDEAVATGPDLAPGLVHALKATLED